MKVNIIKFPTTEQFLKYSKSCQEKEQINDKNNIQPHHISPNFSERIDKEKIYLLNPNEIKYKNKIALKEKNENKHNNLVVRSYKNFQLLLHGNSTNEKKMNFARPNLCKLKQLKPSKFRISRYTIDDIKSDNVFKSESEKAFEKMLTHKKMIEFILKNKKTYRTQTQNANISPINSFTNMMLKLYSKMKIFSSNLFQSNDMKNAILENESISNKETFMRKINNSSNRLYQAHVDKNDSTEKRNSVNYSTNYSKNSKFNTFEFMNKVIEKESLIRKQEQIRGQCIIMQLMNQN